MTLSNTPTPRPQLCSLHAGARKPPLSQRLPLVVLALVLGLLSSALVACRPKPILEEVSLEPSLITPNADGDTDIAVLSFILNKDAEVSITLSPNDGPARGEIYYFRHPRLVSVRREPYTVYFGGVVDGFSHPSDGELPYTVLRRMLPDGAYSWTLTAETEDGESAAVTGTIVIQDADTVLPGIRGFSVHPKVFTPNQDGISDRVTINLVLEKDVEELLVYLRGANGQNHYIAEDERVTEPNAKGWHTYDYDGGIDAGSEPPPDGAYTLYAEAQDAMGQHVIVSDTVEIVNAGLPRAYIVNGEVTWSATTLVISETLCFTLTVENDSHTHIRTTGPWPGTLYRSDQNFNTLGWHEESGVFRVAVDFDTSLRNYPFRWGIGRPGVDLVEIDGYWYLPPQARSLVTGCVEIVDVPVRNPLYYWTGLIHEDVRIAPVNNRVDPNYVQIWEP